MSESNGKPLRFGPLVRVSTEKQEQQGESLRTQRSQNERDVALMGGTIVAWYGGQEHATPGWEKKELDRLIADAGKDKYDAVLVAHADRWSRDNAKSDEGLAVFRKHGIRFFVGTMEYDLFNPDHVLILGMSVVFGRFQAANQNKKSILNRIARARRGLPACGKRPFGRIWDADKQAWTVDPAKQAMIEDVANRYLAGEQLPKLAKEYGQNHSNLCKVLRERCGTQWVLEFCAPDLNIDQKVPVTIPRLLPEQTIQAVRQRLEANRTYLHKPPRPKHEYLLSGRVFCAECGYCMFGQVNHNGHLYYRHAHTERVRECRLQPRPWVRADAIEAAVVHDLFNMLGNPAAIERAVTAAIPDCEKALNQRQHVEEELAKIGKARDRVLGLIEKDALTDAQAETKLRDLKDREAGLRAELDKLAVMLAEVPDAETVRRFVEQVGDAIFVLDDEGNTYAGGNDVQSFLMMTAGDKRKLVDAALSGNMPDSKPAGVYITPAGGPHHGPKRFTYQVRGRLLGSAVPRALHCTIPDPPGRRSYGRFPRSPG
jgi:DNA invertase Pin-like site-specific DNA recombinase